ncbi:UxaA family hydrolase [Cohnella sp. WQ 127256]|uniref:UxaA family hydrolase n=1 Tax=Cohnella sp. WQ 127256 TaxID=2938790 RepID=UPI002119659D|nr:UxaA family hydrolase [Cohnella sp. WQ 127256]
MNDKFHQASFQIEKDDNVAVALSDLEPGSIRIHGSSLLEVIVITDAVKQGHKIANRMISEGEPVLKYGVPIGIAIHDIEAGKWVHLHNCKSYYDKRSSTLDLESGAPTDIQYD